MLKYTRNQSRVKALTANDTPEIRAAVNFVLAVEEGRLPGTDYKLLAEAFKEIFAGQHPKEIFGMSLGLISPKGRQLYSGFTPAEIVSAVIEIELRRLNKAPGSASKAINHAISVFVDIDKGPSGKRCTQRDWKSGQKLVESLTDTELVDLIKPYEVRQKMSFILS